MKHCFFSLFLIVALASMTHAAKKIKGDTFGPGAAPFENADGEEDETCVPIDRDESECTWQRQGSLRSSPRGVRISCKLRGLSPSHAYTVWFHFLDGDGNRFPAGRGAFGCSDDDGDGDFKTDGWLTASLAGDDWTLEQWLSTDGDAVVIDHGPCDDSIDQFSTPTVGCDPSLFQCQKDATNGNNEPYCYVVGTTVFEG